MINYLDYYFHQNSTEGKSKDPIKSKSQIVIITNFNDIEYLQISKNVILYLKN